MKSVNLFIALAALAAISCRGYQPGSFAYHGKPFPGAQVTQGCIEAAVAANHDSVASGTVARFSLANRCDRATPVDFTRIVARHRGPSGAWRNVEPTDPRGELRQVSLEARTVAVEYLEYDLGENAVGTICFDLARLSASEAASDADVCLDVRTAEVL